MKSNYKFALPLLFAASVSFAANKVGNGGDGVFCKGGAYLLDFYEEKVSLESKLTDPATIAENQLNILKEAAPKLAEQYLKRLRELPKETEYKSGIVLTDIKDSEHLFAPSDEDCQVLQIAIRRAKPLPGEKRFLFREDLWKRFSPLHQAGLLTHEIIYEHLVKLGAEDSVKARRINRALYQKEIKKEDFWRLIKDLEIPVYP